MRHGARRRITGKRATLLVAWLLGVIGIIGAGGFASFTRSASGSTQVTSGTMTLTVPANGSTNRLSVSASNIVPGDTIERVVDLVSGGTVAQTITLATTAAPSSLLDTDGTNGLQMVIDACSIAWVESGPPYTYATGRVVTDGVTNSTTTVTSATAGFTGADVGRNISGAGIPASTTISSVTNGTTVVISAAATATATGVTLTIGAGQTCGASNAGTVSTVLASRAWIGSGLALSNLVNPGTTHLHIKLTFPGATSSTTFQGLASTVTYTFTGAQRAGQAQ